MFKKLRNKFLILNLIIISIMMLMAFTSIYLITYNDVRRDIDMELHKISDFDREPKEKPNLKESNVDRKDLSPDFKNVNPRLKRSVSFFLVTDKQGNLTEIVSVFDMDDSIYEDAKNLALSMNKNTGSFRLDDTHWAFIINPHSNGYRISFLDITSQYAILRNLIYTFLIVAAVMLFFIYFISRFIANRSITPIKEAFDKQKQFIADASHELKTPLAVINTNADVLLANENDSIKSQSKWLHYIKSETDRMTKLTNDLLYLTQMDHSDIKMIFSDFNLSETVENIILTMEAIIFEKNINLDYTIEPNLMTYGNIEQIKQVIIILLDNAIKYVDKKGSIDITLNKSRNMSVLSITNTGEGIPEDHIDKVFDRFYRTDKSRARESGGYGLGLAIAKTIIENHRGNIYANSILNGKTTFTVELPLNTD